MTPSTSGTSGTPSTSASPLRPTSSAQFAASISGAVPPTESVRDDVWALAIPMPGGHIPYSFSYLLRDRDGVVHVIDPGLDADDNWAVLCDALASVGGSADDVGSIIVTHLHPDHLGMAERLRRASGAPVVLHAAEQRALSGWLTRGGDALSSDAPSPVAQLNAQLDDWGVPAHRRAELAVIANRAPSGSAFTADVLVEDGDRLNIPGFDITALLTPGHTPGHLCLVDNTRALLYSGDHVLPTMHGGLGLGGPTATNALADYLGALERVARYPEHEVLPGHGYRFRGVAFRAAQSAEHHLRRSREVAAVLREGGNPTIWHIATRLTWTAGWENLSGFFLWSALSQTGMHREFVTERPMA